MKLFCNPRVFSAGLVLFAMPSGVVAQDKPVKLAYTTKVGDVTREKMTINANIMGMDIVVKITNKSTVKEVKPSGDIVTVEKAESTVINFGGNEQEQNSDVEVTATKDKYGKLVDVRSPDTGQEFLTKEVQKASAMLQGIVFPKDGAKPGESWTTEYDNPIIKGKKISIKTTFVGLEKADGKEYWRIKQTGAADTAEGAPKLTVEFSALLIPATGQTFKMEGTTKDLPTAQVGVMNWAMKLERLDAAAAPKPKP